MSRSVHISRLGAVIAKEWIYGTYFLVLIWPSNNLIFKKIYKYFERDIHPISTLNFET